MRWVRTSRWQSAGFLRTSRSSPFLPALFETAGWLLPATAVATEAREKTRAKARKRGRIGLLFEFRVVRSKYSAPSPLGAPGRIAWLISSFPRHQDGSARIVIRLTRRRFMFLVADELH